MSSLPELPPLRCRGALIVAGLIACAVAVTGRAAPVAYQAPEEKAALADAPGKDLAEANCLGCHSADYISTQPRGPGFGRAFWEAEVHKMIAVYGAPIDAADAPKIADYLAAAYGEAPPSEPGRSGS